MLVNFNKHNKFTDFESSYVFTYRIITSLYHVIQFGGGSYFMQGCYESVQITCLHPMWCAPISPIVQTGTEPGGRSLADAGFKERGECSGGGGGGSGKGRGCGRGMCPLPREARKLLKTLIRCAKMHEKKKKKTCSLLLKYHDMVT